MTSRKKRISVRKKRSNTKTKLADKAAKHATAKKTKSKVQRVDTKAVRNADPVPEQKTEIPKIEPARGVEFDLYGSAAWSKRMDRRTSDFVGKLEWSWTPVNERMESYYLQRCSHELTIGGFSGRNPLF
jgi:hypothetical protein